MKKISRRGGAYLLTVLMALAAGFGWGFLSHYRQLFPFRWLRATAVDLGIIQAHVGLDWRGAAPPRPDLRASPYLAGTFDPNSRESGVLVSDAERAMPGGTLVITRREGRALAVLVGLDGQPLWTWPLTVFQSPHSAVLLANGDLVVVDAGSAVARLDRSGQLRWRVVGQFHHEVAVVGDHILALRSHPRVEPRIHSTAKVLDDEIVRLDLEGNELESLSILESLIHSPYGFLVPSPADAELERIAGRRPFEFLELDLLHTNQISPTGFSAARVEALARPGNLLISIRNLSLLVVLDGGSHEVLWAWGPGRLVYQHHSTLLPSGRLLVFNNGLARSEVLEVDPETHRVEWSYHADDFFTDVAGSCQRLDNGNTLITESMTGYVFEVTPQGELVWVWANPDISADGTRRSLYRATRYRLEKLGWLESS